MRSAIHDTKIVYRYIIAVNRDPVITWKKLNFFETLRRISVFRPQIYVSASIVMDLSGRQIMPEGKIAEKITVTAECLSGHVFNRRFAFVVQNVFQRTLRPAVKYDAAAVIRQLLAVSPDIRSDLDPLPCFSAVER